MIEVLILIPVRSNDGVTFTTEEHALFEAKLVETFGGFSILPLHVVGAWADNGVIYRDETRVYAVFLAGIGDGGKVTAVVTTAKAHYGQHAIAIRYLNLSEIL